MVWTCGKNGWVPYGQKAVDCGSGGRVRGGQRLGWRDGVKVAVGNWGMTVEAARQYTKDEKTGEPWCMCNWMSFTLGPVLFRTPLPCSGGYHLEMGGCRHMMRLGKKTVKRAQLLKIKAQVSSILAKGCMLDYCVCVLSDLTWLPLLGGGRKSCYIYIIIIIIISIIIIIEITKGKKVN